MKKPLLLILVSLFSFGLYAQNAAPCSSPEYRQFDFWIGDWDVYSGDSIVGHNRVDLINGKCVIMENWTGKGGSTGNSFNLYNRKTKRWEQTWVDNVGSSIVFSGHYKDGTMALTGNDIARDGKPVMYKLTFWNNDDGTVRQLWEASKTKGKEWSVLFDGLYKKKG